MSEKKIPEVVKMVTLRQDLFDRLPVDKTSRDEFINNAIKRELNIKILNAKAGKTKSEAKAAAARENGKKGGRPKIQQK